MIIFIKNEKFWSYEDYKIKQLHFNEARPVKKKLYQRTNHNQSNQHEREETKRTDEKKKKLTITFTVPFLISLPRLIICKYIDFFIFVLSPFCLPKS